VEIFLNWQKLCTESSLSSVRKVTSLFVGLLSFFQGYLSQLGVSCYCCLSCLLAVYIT